MYIQSGSQHLDEKFVEFHADTSIHRCTLYIILYDTHMNICIIWMRGDARGCEGCERNARSTLGGCRQLGEKVVDTSGSDWYSTAANNTLSQSAAV
jgi:hypothetical protein